MKIVFKSGFRAPLINPSRPAGTTPAHYEFVPWSGGPPQICDSHMTIDEGCEGLGGFSPKISAGSTDAQGGAHSPFTFTLTRQDGEENLAALEVTLPRGMAATFAGIPRCEGAAAETGQCPAESRVGRVTASAGAGPNPLWVPQPGKRPTAVYLAGPYKDAPLSVVAVVPAQAGPFDLGDQVVAHRRRRRPGNRPGDGQIGPDAPDPRRRPRPLPHGQRLLDRPGFTLNPTSCARKETTSALHSTGGKTATPSSPFAATDCDRLGFKPKLAMRLFGGTHRGSHPRLRAILTHAPGRRQHRLRLGRPAALGVPRPGPHQDRLHQGAVRGRPVPSRARSTAALKARTPLLDETLKGPVYLRSSNNPLPDMVAVSRCVVV